MEEADHALSRTRLSFYESMDLVCLSGSEARGPTSVSRFMSTRAAWLPMSDLRRLFQPALDATGEGTLIAKLQLAAFGGHVYAQSMLAVCKAVAADERRKGMKEKEGRLGLHTIHGTWNAAGHSDRPFIYEVNPVSAARSFQTYLVNARQPICPSTSASGDNYPLSDASLPLAQSPCFTALITLKLPELHSGGTDVQEDPPQARYATILSSRRPEDWPPAPLIDIDSVQEALRGARPTGTFPILDMRKVDMSGWNAGRAVPERRELILYRLLKPLPTTDGQGETIANQHIAAHAYESDRNGLLMVANHLGFGHAFGRAASLEYSLLVHTNADEAMMEGDSWWIQEASAPRAAAGRATLLNKIWSPRGVHVATGLQDGICRAKEGRERL